MDRQLSISETTAHNWQQSVATMRSLKSAALTNEAAVTQSEANWHQHRPPPNSPCPAGRSRPRLPPIPADGRQRSEQCPLPVPFLRRKKPRTHPPDNCPNTERPIHAIPYASRHRHLPRSADRPTRPPHCRAHSGSRPIRTNASCNQSLSGARGRTRTHVSSENKRKAAYSIHQ